MSYIAHFRETDLAIHELRDHLWWVAEKCDEFGSSAGLGKLKKITGLLHDMGMFYLIALFQQKMNARNNESAGRLAVLCIFR